ncbi:hypothetical protein AA0472_2703 [Acetobacter estunensis NRIC 0472]|uniref:Uncharacterized protein n=1 Tax=Acetobacter estunensis TaxID=104097 RepID=A0A967B4V1_9PROT|nr:hypothetical protein [Acetobacter estunensis]NHO52860.1 hypothetical protein [Acetobacter estunensis]GBQ28434.1 hypothetical protein AA0472_2703 [Acetobacter estunensis NRIC 0472]
MNKLFALLIAGVALTASQPILAAETQSCTSGVCQSTEKGWKTVRNGTVNAAHSTTKWSEKTGKKIGTWGSHTTHNVGQWGSHTGHKIGQWGSNATKDTKHFFTGN